MNLRAYRDKAKAYAEDAAAILAEAHRVGDDQTLYLRAIACANLAQAYAQLAQVERVTPLA